MKSGVYLDDSKTLMGKLREYAWYIIIPVGIGLGGLIYFQPNVIKGFVNLVNDARTSWSQYQSGLDCEMGFPSYDGIISEGGFVASFEDDKELDQLIYRHSFVYYRPSEVKDGVVKDLFSDPHCAEDPISW